MSSPSGPSWTRGYYARRRASTIDPNLRVSDAERADVADRLSKHYGDGRLDQAEFNERIERAMNAKTHGELSGLLDDLPPAEPPAGLPPAPRRRPPFPRLLAIVAIIVLVSVAWHLAFHPFYFFFLPVPWLLIALVAFLLLRRGSWRYRGGQGPR